MELSLFGEIRREFVLVEPAAPSAGGGNEFGVCQLVGMDMIEEAAVDELLRFDGFVAISFREMIREVRRKGELVIAESGKFAVVVVAGIGAGEGEIVRGVDGEVELGSEFEVDEIAGGFFAEEEIQLADGSVDVFADLEVFFEEIEGG